MKNFTSLIGWLLLAAILAVPSFLFYNWWASNKKNETATQAPVQSVSTATIFAGSQDTPTQTSPPAFPQQQKTAPVEKHVQENVHPASAARVSTAAAKSQRLTQSTAAVQESATPAAQAMGLTQAVSTSSYYNPKSDRDPTITTEEYRTMKEAENFRRETERQREFSLHRQLKEAGGESRIKLQGIVGNSVIINGEMYAVGNTVQGVKLLKIGSNYVIGEYKGKKFRKILQ
ncbi:MAG: hypothetical protein A2218_12230 [Elusimicrobia bacterium RIFOXYA2_FULL_53_38]|nr:MAG: hypothetical protein A2218_12230 [Elusimicrobia bacterium RIFOXYA2_FULL_53_38]